MPLSSSAIRRWIAASAFLCSSRTKLRRSEAVLHGRALALALAADRSAHMEEDIIPRLDAGWHVVTDRYVPSSLVLQALDGLDLPEIWSYNRYVLPAITSTWLARAWVLARSACS